MTRSTWATGTPGSAAADYDAFIDKYLRTVSTLFPNALLHFEDFGPGNARRILLTYQDRYRIFNDDMQGTGGDRHRGLLTALKVSGPGGGTSGWSCSAAAPRASASPTRSATQMVRDGLEQEQAGPAGLDRGHAGTAHRRHERRAARLPAALRAPGRRGAGWATTPIQVDPSRRRAGRRWPPCSRPGSAGIIGLQTVVERVRPTILIGCSTAHGAFTRPVIKAMSAGVERPVIFPISNPTSQIEAMPADIIAWSAGQALVATGLPMEPVGVRRACGTRSGRPTTR